LPKSSVTTSGLHWGKIPGRNLLDEIEQTVSLGKRRGTFSSQGQGEDAQIDKSKVPHTQEAEMGSELARAITKSQPPPFRAEEKMGGKWVGGMSLEAERES